MGPEPARDLNCLSLVMDDDDYVLPLPIEQPC
jgi:hypothetical protein